VLALFALLAGSCGDGTSAEPDASPAPADDGVGDDTGEEDSDDDTPTDPVEDDTTDGGETPVDPPELTATWTGVTEDTIRVGVLAIDTEAVAAFGVDLVQIDAHKAYGALADEFNAAGGAYGREVEIHVELFLPVGSVDSDRACSVLTEDVEVFVAVGQLLDDNPLCFTELHDTPYVGAFGLTNQRDERSNGNFFAVGMQVEKQRGDSVVALYDAGVFDGARVGLFWAIGDKPIVDDALRPLLAELGVDVVSEGQLDDFAGDTVASEQAADTIFARFEAEGADLLLNVSSVVAFGRAVERNAFEGQLVMLNGQMTGQLVANSDFDPDIFLGGVGATGSGATPEELLEDELWLECVEILNDSGRFDEELTAETLEEELAGSIRATCGVWRLLEQMLIAAGTELTPDTLREGGESLTDLQLPGVLAGSLGPDDHSVGDSVRLFEYDPDEQLFVPTSDLIVIDR
jgi:hypothetical protein